MALKQQMGLGGLGVRRGQVQIKVTVMDVYGNELFRPSTFLADASKQALMLARYWLRRGDTLVRISDAKGARGCTFRGKARQHFWGVR